MTYISEQRYRSPPPEHIVPGLIVPRSSPPPKTRFLCHLSHVTFRSRRLTFVRLALASIIPLIIGIITKTLSVSLLLPHCPRPVPFNMNSQISRTFLTQIAVTISLNPSSLQCSPSHTLSAWRALSPDLDDKVAWSLSVSPLLTATTALGGFCHWMCFPFGLA